MRKPEQVATLTGILQDLEQAGALIQMVISGEDVNARSLSEQERSDAAGLLLNTIKTVESEVKLLHADATKIQRKTWANRPAKS